MEHLPESMQQCRTKGRGIRSRILPGYVHPTVGHNFIIQIHKGNFSALKTKNDLQEVCSKPISIIQMISSHFRRKSSLTLLT